MEHKISCQWLENLAFDAEIDGHHVTMDASKDLGGEDRGPRPKPLLLASLAGCTGIDVMSILKKMRVTVNDCHIEVIGHQTETNPKIYDRIQVIYTFRGNNLPRHKLERAVQLSEQTYCGVSAMLKQAGLLEYTIRVEETT